MKPSVLLSGALITAAAVVACADQRPPRDPYGSYGSTNTTGGDTYYGNAPSTTVYSSQPSSSTLPQVNGIGEHNNEELQITAAIRKTLASSTTLSENAKNAKIITQGTKVTLRGSVTSEAEKTELENVARGTPGVTEVDNKLDVMASTPK